MLKQRLLCLGLLGLGEDRRGGAGRDANRGGDGGARRRVDLTHAAQNLPKGDLGGGRSGADALREADAEDKALQEGAVEIPNDTAGVLGGNGAEGDRVDPRELSAAELRIIERLELTHHRGALRREVAALVGEEGVEEGPVGLRQCAHGAREEEGAFGG